MKGNIPNTEYTIHSIHVIIQPSRRPRLSLAGLIVVRNAVPHNTVNEILIIKGSQSSSLIRRHIAMGTAIKADSINNSSPSRLSCFRIFICRMFDALEVIESDFISQLIFRLFSKNRQDKTRLRYHPGGIGLFLSPFRLDRFLSIRQASIHQAI